MNGLLLAWVIQLAQQEMGTVGDFIKTLTSLGGATIMGMFTWFWLTGRIYTKSTYSEMRDERNYWRETCVRGMNLNERMTRATAQVPQILAETVKKGSDDGNR